MKVQRLDIETMKIEYNISKSALPAIISSEDIVRTTPITKVKALKYGIKSPYDNILSYCGNEDQWMYPAISLRKTSIAQNTRLCQFRIQLSQKATLLQKLKWLFTSGIELVEVESLGNENRSGLGSTGTTSFK